MSVRVRIIPDRDLEFFTLKKFGRGEFPVTFKGKRNVKDLLESVGIPHVEIGLVEIQRDGLWAPAAVDDLICTDCSLRLVSAAFTADFSVPADISLLRFVLDVHLGRLSANLRMLGFNTDYSNQRDDEELTADVSATPAPCTGILLSCDRGLLKRSGVRTGLLIRSRKPIIQTAEVLRRFRLSSLIRPFSVCINCGEPLKDAGVFTELGDDEKRRIPPSVRISGFEYSRCSGCGQLFWPGTHLDRMREKIEAILSLVDTGS